MESSLVSLKLDYRTHFYILKIVNITLIYMLVPVVSVNYTIILDSS